MFEMEVLVKDACRSANRSQGAHYFQIWRSLVIGTLATGHGWDQLPHMYMHMYACQYLLSLFHFTCHMSQR